MFSDRPDFNDKKNHKILRHGHLTFYLIKDRRAKTSSPQSQLKDQELFIPMHSYYMNYIAPNDTMVF